MRFIEYENDNLPFSCLPYAFKCRLIQLASLDDAAKVTIACSDMEAHSGRRREFYNKVFITDDLRAYDLAKERTGDPFDFCYMRLLADGPLTIDPCWRSLMLVDEIVSKNRSFFVGDTLVAFLTSMESYDRVIPLIAGAYSRLVLYGHVSWTQVTKLIHGKVKQVRIMGVVEVEPENYDDVVEFVLHFIRGLDYKFSFHNESFVPDLMEKLNKACTGHPTHSLIHCSNELVHFIYKKSCSVYYFDSFIINLAHLVLIFAVWSLCFDWFDDLVLTLPFVYLKMLIYGGSSLLLVFSLVLPALKSFNEPPMDIKVQLRMLKLP